MLYGSCPDTTFMTAAARALPLAATAAVAPASVGAMVMCVCRRSRERGPRFSNRAEDLRVTQEVEDLFTEATRVLARTTRRYPVNISSINDIMRHRDRSVTELSTNHSGFDAS